MSVYSFYKSDSALEVKGVWKKFPGANIEVLIARSGGRNKDFAQAQASILQEIGFEKVQTMTEDEFNQAMIPAYAAHVVKGIRGEGWVDENGNRLKDDVDTISSALHDLPDLYEEIRTYATLRSTFRKEQEEAIAGN